jgi:uncharacterized repeat protein (TIGR03806 family)
LSETGLFADTAKHIPAPGVIPYDVNVPIWRDHATMERFMAIPGDEKIDYRWDNAWNFPDGSVMVQTVYMDMEAGNPASRKRIETRLLHKELTNWWNYTYVWNDEQTDAELLLDKKGRDKKLTIKDAKAPNGAREMIYHIPSRAECGLCHTMPANYLLGVTTLQMNRDFKYDGVTMNQIKAFEKLGLFKQNPEKAHDGKKVSFAESKLPPLHDESQPLEKRARAYMHVNCAHCHMKWGGGNSGFWVPYNLTLAETTTVNNMPTHGTLDIADPKIIAPGHPEKSVLPLRMKKLDPHLRMPRAGSNVVDEEGVKLIERWILELK